MRSIYTLGLKVLELLETIHDSGYVHNDLSLDKIAVGLNQRVIPDKSKDCFENKSLHIIDYTYMTPFIDLKTRKHLRQEKVKGIFNVNNDF